jgi:hypothetical protein
VYCKRRRRQKWPPIQRSWNRWIRSCTTSRRDFSSHQTRLYISTPCSFLGQAKQGTKTPFTITLGMCTHRPCEAEPNPFHYVRNFTPLFNCKIVDWRISRSPNRPDLTYHIATCFINNGMRIVECRSNNLKRIGSGQLPTVPGPPGTPTPESVLDSNPYRIGSGFHWVTRSGFWIWILNPVPDSVL